MHSSKDKKIKIQWTDPDGNILKEEHVTSVCFKSKGGKKTNKDA